MSDIAAIVVTYNRRELLKENIESLLKQTIVPDILIVDNNSNDGTYEMLRPLIDTKIIHYYNTGANLGGAGGFQYGIRQAVTDGYKYLWVMDDDCMPKERALEELVNADQQLNGEYGFLSSKVLWEDGSICKMNVQRHPLTKNISDFNADLIPATMASFVSFFIKASVVTELGLPIKEFFIWTDDWEYTRRISRQYSCYVVTKSVVIHKSKTNISADISNDSMDRLDRYQYLYRNDVYLYRREGIKGFTYEVIRLLVHTVRVIVKAKDHKAKRIGIIVKGTIAGLTFHPEIEKVRSGI